MKKITLFILLGLMAACGNGVKNPEKASENTENAPTKILTVDEVFDVWKNQELTSMEGDILSLVEAFNDAMPTYSVNAFLKEIQLPEDEQEYLVEVDMADGYVSFAEGSDDLSAESMCARVWNRSDGHQLFAISFDQPSSRQVAYALFYDYDPATGKLYPEKSPVDDFRVSFPNSIFSILLPQEGDDVVVHEYFMNCWISIYHTYPWDGQYLDYPETTIENMDQMVAMYEQNYWADENHPFTQYCLHDFDDDGEPELWLGSDNEEFQAIYSIVQAEIQLIAGADYKRQLMLFPKVVGDAGGCGTGCFYTCYNILENSLPKSVLADMQSYNFSTDEMEDEYSLNDLAITVEEGDALVESFGEPIEITPDWRPLYIELF